MLKDKIKSIKNNVKGILRVALNSQSTGLQGMLGGLKGSV